MWNVAVIEQGGNVSNKGRSLWVPAGTFLLAVLISIAAGPARPAISRQQTHPTGGQCCHIARIMPAGDFVVELQGQAFMGLASWQLAFVGSTGGRLAAEGSARNGRVTTPNASATVRLRLKRTVSESCRHRAHATGKMQVRYQFAVPGTAKTGPFPVNSTGCHLKAQMDSRLESDLERPTDHKIVREALVTNNADAGFAANLSEKPGVTIPFDLKLGRIESGDDDADLERQFLPFDEQADFRMTSRIGFSVYGNINVTSVTASVVADLLVPLGLEDRDEPVYARFATAQEYVADPRFDFVLKESCDTPEQRVNLPPNPKNDDKMKEHVKGSPDPR